jgi:hypothetical protein
LITRTVRPHVCRRTVKILHYVNRLILWVMMVLYVPLIVGVVVALCAGGYFITAFVVKRAVDFRPGWIWSAVGALAVDLCILGISLMLLLGLVPLLFRRVMPEGGGLRLRATDHPTLFQLISRFCKRFGTRQPDEVYLTPLDDTAIGDLTVEDEGGQIRKNIRTLWLGAALVVHLRADEFGTVLCHELAHAATGDTRFSQTADRFFRSMAAAIELRQAEPDPDDTFMDRLLGGVIVYLLIAYYSLFRLFYTCDSRWRELRADRMSAEVCGPQNVRNALIRSCLCETVPELRLQDLFMEYFVNERDVQNVYREYRNRWKNLPAARVQEVENAIFMYRRSAWDSHPSMPERIRALRRVTAKEWVVDKPATALFHNWSALERAITRELVTWGRSAFAAHLERLDRELRLPI